jgi:hypothetical protein
LANGSGTNYAAGATAQTFVADTTLYAKWTANTYIAAYNSNSATSGTVPSSQSYISGTTGLTLATNTGNLARIGYSFIGWNTASDGNGTSYSGLNLLANFKKTSLISDADRNFLLSSRTIAILFNESKIDALVFFFFFNPWQWAL